MTRMISYKRLLSMALAFCLVLSMLPPITIPVFSETSTPKPFVPVDGKYDDLIGYSAALNFEDWIYLVICDDPTIDVLYGQELVATDLMNPVVLVIADCYWDAETCALWLKVKAADGYELPEKLQTYPWVFQNYTDVYEEEGWEAYSSDSLLLTAPAYKEPTSIVADGGVTVNTDEDLLTDLIVTDTAAPSVYYFHQAVAYRMTPKTNDGKYTGQAKITIPVPEEWDLEKVMGFVVNGDGTVSAIPGTVNRFGDFCFTVPHFSVVGLFEATTLADVPMQTLTLKVGQNQVVYLQGNIPAEGTYLSDDGCVEFAVEHNNNKPIATILGVDLTAGTIVRIGDDTYQVIVEPAKTTVNQLLLGTEEKELYALVDLPLNRELYDVSYVETSDPLEVVALEGNRIIGQNKVGGAVVTATVTHKVSHNTVAIVTYDVVNSNVEVQYTRKLFIPNGGSITIDVWNSEINPDVPTDPTICNVEVKYEQHEGAWKHRLTMTATADSGQTAVMVDKVLVLIYVVPNNPNYTNKVGIMLKSIKTVDSVGYYSINGGDLHRFEGGGQLIYWDATWPEEFPDAMSLMIFSAPEDGYTTAGITFGNTNHLGQFYSLVDGVLHDGSDSNAWPLVSPDAENSPENYKWENGNVHGISHSLNKGFTTVAGLRDLFSRAIALGCDSVATFTRTGNANQNGDRLEQDVTIIAQKLPTFEKEITGYILADGTQVDGYQGEALEIGTTVIYQFVVQIHSENITYSNIVITDYNITSEGNAATTIQVKDEHFENGQYVVELRYQLAEADIEKYAKGEFWNKASMSYSYQSSATKGAGKTESMASVKCNVSSIITWTDGFGNVLKVSQMILNSTVYATDYPAEPTHTAYTCTGWDQEAGFTVENTDSITINAKWEPTQYDIWYVDGLDSTVIDGLSGKFCINNMIILPEITKEGYTFLGWKATAWDEISNWSAVGDMSYPPGTAFKNRYGNVTFTAQWAINQYTITFDSNGGTPVESITQDYGTAVTAPTAPTKEGFTFAGWEPALPETMPAQDMTLKAVWTTSLTIEVAGWQSTDANQAFLFRIEGEGLDLYVAVYGNESVVIEGLIDGGSYTVTEVSDWSWRYGNIRWDYDKDALDPTASEVARIQINGTGKITFVNSRTNPKWLDGNNWLKRNIYRN